jgi:hypothetical protein
MQKLPSNLVNIGMICSVLIISLAMKTIALQLISQQNHLSDKQQSKIADILHKYKKLFDGTLGWYPHQQQGAS